MAVPFIAALPLIAAGAFRLALSVGGKILGRQLTVGSAAAISTVAYVAPAALAAVDNATDNTLSDTLLSENTALNAFNAYLKVSSTVDKPIANNIQHHLERALESRGKIDTKAPGYNESSTKLILEAASRAPINPLLAAESIADLGNFGIQATDITNCYMRAKKDHAEKGGATIAVATFDNIKELVNERRLEKENALKAKQAEQAKQPTPEPKLDKKDTLMPQVERTLDLDKLSKTDLATAFSKATDEMWSIPRFLFKAVSSVIGGLSLVGVFSETAQASFQKWAIPKSDALRKWDVLKESKEFVSANLNKFGLPFGSKPDLTEQPAPA